MKRPIILVDLDNVVYDFIRQMGRWLKVNHVLPQGYDHMEEYVSWAVWEDWNVPKGEFFRWWRLGIENGFIFGEGELIPGARDALWRLSDAEWDIQICTNRLSMFGLHDVVAANTVKWLAQNNIPYRGLLLTNHKTEMFAQAIIDDRADNMDELAHERTFLFPANHNTGKPIYAMAQIQAWNDIVNELMESELVTS